MGGMGETGDGEEEDIYHDDHWVMYRTAESLCCAPETNITLYVSYSGIKKIIIHENFVLPIEITTHSWDMPKP